MNKHTSQPGLLAGFTLVELLLVILILSSLALVTTFMVDNMNEQFRFDQTKSRLEQIRRAIIGDSGRTLNGQPEISGFVADMGRLPVSLRELIEKPDTSAEWDGQEVTLSGVGATSYILHGGWRGPYLETLPESEGELAFRDGWGNFDPDLSGVEVNYGWEFTSDASGVIVQSLGADGEAGEVDPDNPYHKDYPADGRLVNGADWRVNLQGHPVRVQINRTTTGEDDLELQVYFLEDGVQQTPILGGLGQTLSGVASQMLNGSFDNEEAFIPMGTHLAVVVCVANGLPYDGDCDGTTTTTLQPQYIKIIPRAYTPPLQLEWNTQ